MPQGFRNEAKNVIVNFLFDVCLLQTVNRRRTSTSLSFYWLAVYTVYHSCVVRLLLSINKTVFMFVIIMMSQPELQAERVPGDLPGVPRQALRLGLHRGTHRRQTVAQPVCVLCTGHGHTDTRTHTHTHKINVYILQVLFVI